MMLSGGGGGGMAEKKDDVGRSQVLFIRRATKVLLCDGENKSFKYNGLIRNVFLQLLWVDTSDN